MSKKKTYKEFLEELKEKNYEMYLELEFLEEYVNMRTKILAKNRYGKILTNPTVLLRGGTPDIQSALDKTDYIRNQILEKYPDYFNERKFVGEYINNRTKILIEDKFGLCSISPSNLLNGNETCICNSIDKTSYWIEMAKEVHGDKYDYDKARYISVDKEVLIYCKKHKKYFTKIASEHIRGHGCRLCYKENNPLYKAKEHEVFINEIKELSVDFFNNIEFLNEYKNCHAKVLIIDKFGTISISPNNLLKALKKGNEPSIASATNKTDYALEMIKYYREDNGSFYDYSDFVYNGGNEKSIFICPNHKNKEDGIFEQEFWAHLRNQGCPHCAENHGWSRSKWIECGKKSQNFDSYKVYKIKCFDDFKNEEFYKIGITYQTIERRFGYGNKEYFPYNYEIIEIIESYDGRYIWDLEKELHSKHKEYKYIPKIEFGGMYECFSKLL